jgi:polyphosphate kinase
VERYLREASVDPKVRAIKMTLYRTAGRSRVIEYLIDAARNGKQVAVVLELKARFDEQANIRWAGALEEAGIHVTYGVVGLKTHCKVIFVIRRDYDGLRRYAHIGTGNYHAGTARMYCDLGLLTCDPDIGADLTELLNYLTSGYTPMRRYRKLLCSPRQLKQALLEKIEREIKGHGPSSPGLIQLKANGLEDRDLVAALYRASQAGVRVDLIIRDTCRLRPGIAGLSENIRVLSLVGRFLEHARVYYFRNGGDEEYFIGSADLMQRNLESRVEVCVPVESSRLRQQLREMLDLQLRNRRNVWEMGPDGEYRQREARGREGAVCIHRQLIERAEKQRSGRKKSANRKKG